MSAKKSKKKTKKQDKKKAKKAKKKVSLAPKPVKTGKGETPLEVAQTVAGLIRSGRSGEVEEKFHASGIESVEGVGMSMAWSGKKAVLAKYRGWEADHEIHAMDVEGPWVGATGFALRFSLDATQKSTGQRNQMEEIAVYTVKNGKIVREEFHFRAPEA
jgi:SnoaL-like domain